MEDVVFLQPPPKCDAIGQAAALCAAAVARCGVNSPAVRVTSFVLHEIGKYVLGLRPCARRRLFFEAASGLYTFCLSPIGSICENPWRVYEQSLAAIQVVGQLDEYGSVWLMMDKRPENGYTDTFLLWREEFVGRRLGCNKKTAWTTSLAHCINKFDVKLKEAVPQQEPHVQFPLKSIFTSLFQFSHSDSSIAYGNELTFLDYPWDSLRVHTADLSRWYQGEYETITRTIEYSGPLLDTCSHYIPGLFWSHRGAPFMVLRDASTSFIVNLTTGTDTAIPLFIYTQIVGDNHIHTQERGDYLVYSADDPTAPPSIAGSAPSGSTFSTTGFCLTPSFHQSPGNCESTVSAVDLCCLTAGDLEHPSFTMLTKSFTRITSLPKAFISFEPLSRGLMFPKRARTTTNNKIP
ncbi:hypothetical protein Pelo_15062 [Pelomyxa schiedti]|nr:hypothetical protein Pelo_15062 [Pelomyxa schiedti]